MNALFDFMYKYKQNFVIRLKENRKLFWKGKWFKSATLRDSRKGKIKTSLTFRIDGKEKRETVYISHLNVKITASRNMVNLILVYGLGEKPMMLATNEVIKGKEEFVCKPKTATDNPAEIGAVDYAILSTKSYDLEGVLLQLQPSINQETVILPLLNGVDTRKKIKAFYPQNLVLDGCVYIVSSLPYAVAYYVVDYHNVKNCYYFMRNYWDIREKAVGTEKGKIGGFYVVPFVN